MGGLVRMLQLLPQDHPDRKRFEQQFKEMAAKLAHLQQADGLWRASLLDPAELSAQGNQRLGLLHLRPGLGRESGPARPRAYEPAVRKAWAALVGCVAATAS